MRLTREAIDLFVPKHDRASCDDKGLQNDYMDIEEDYLYKVMIGRRWKNAPGCTRCVLLGRLRDGEDLPDYISFYVSLQLKQPKFTITAQEGE